MHCACHKLMADETSRYSITGRCPTRTVFNLNLIQAVKVPGLDDGKLHASDEAESEPLSHLTSRLRTKVRQCEEGKDRSHGDGLPGTSFHHSPPSTLHPPSSLLRPPASLHAPHTKRFVTATCPLPRRAVGSSIGTQHNIPAVTPSWPKSPAKELDMARTVA